MSGDGDFAGETAPTADQHRFNRRPIVLTDNMFLREWSSWDAIFKISSIQTE